MSRKNIINVYVDGSVNATTRAMAYAYVACSNTKYISHNYKCIEGNNAAHAETLAIGLAAKDLLSNDKLHLIKEDVIIFNVDCLSALTFMKDKAYNDNPYRGKKEIRDAVECVRSLSRVATVKFVKVAAHKFTHNTNKYVDALAKYACRSGECMQ